MARTLLLGPILNRNRDDLVARCRALLAAGLGHEFLYLAATRPLLDDVTARLLDGMPGVLAPPNVFLLSGFSRRLVAEARFAESGAALPPSAAIDTDRRPVQRPLVARLVQSLAEAGELPAFKPLAQTDGLVDAIVRLIAEIQRAGKSAAEFRAAVAKLSERLDRDKPTPPRPRERDFNSEAATVYERYERLLAANHLTDGNTDSLRALAIARGEIDGERVTIPFLDGLQLLVLDGFFDLLPVHQELVTTLMVRVPEVVINLNCDPANPDAFAAHADVIDRFRGLAGVDVVERTESRDVAPGLVPLRARLFAADGANADPQPPPSSAAAPPNPRIVELRAPDRTREVRGVAKEIKRLVVDRGLEPDRVAIVVRRRETYEPIVREVFADEGIPLASGERRPVLELPAVRAAMKVLDAAVSNRSQSGRDIQVRQLVALAKSDYLGVAPGPTDTSAGALSSDELESAAAHVGMELHLDDWLARVKRLIGETVAEDSPAEPLPFDLDDDGSIESDLESGDADGNGDEADGNGVVPDDRDPASRRRSRPRLDVPIATLRRAAGTMEALGNAVLAIPYRAPVEDVAAAFRRSLADLGLHRRLAGTARRAVGSSEELARAAVDLRAVESLDLAVDAVVESIRLADTLCGGDGQVTRHEFRSDLERALAANSVTLTADTPGGVRVLGVTDTRGLAFDTVFVLGLVEGEFPEKARSDWICPRSERSEFLASTGLPLEDLSPETARAVEEHAFYQTVCRATERLYLCWPTRLEESDTVASPFVDDVRRAAGPFAVHSVSTGLETSDVFVASTRAELARGVALAESDPTPRDARRRALGVFARSVDGAAISADADRRIGIERLRERGGFDAFDGLIDRPDLRQLLRKAYSERLYSATNFSLYGSCGFRFFARDVLGLEPRIDAVLDLQSIDSGTLLHAVLQQYFALHATTDIVSADRDALRSDLRACADRVFDAFEARTPPLNPNVWAIERDALHFDLERYLDAEIGLQEKLGDSRAIERRVEVAFGMARADGDAASVDTPVVVEARGRKVRIIGRIDRIDRSQDGSLVAYDYKSGTGATQKDMSEGRDFQLGIYLEAVDAYFAGDGQRAVAGAYLTFRDVPFRVSNLLADADTPLGKALYGRKRNRAGTAELQELRRKIVDNIANAVERIEDGDFRVAPSSMRICDYCEYRAVCRVEPYRLTHKLRKEGVADVRPLPPPDRTRGRTR